MDGGTDVLPPRGQAQRVEHCCTTSGAMIPQVDSGPAGRGNRLIGSMAVEATSPAGEVPMSTSTRIARLEAISQRRPFTKAAKLTRLAKDSLVKVFLRELCGLRDHRDESSTVVMRWLVVVLVGATVCLGVRGWNATPAAAAAPTILESSALRLEVTAAPYSYAVIEKSTGQVLLRQTETTFTAGTARAASAAAMGRKAREQPRGHAGHRRILRAGARPMDVRRPGRRAGAVGSGQGHEHH